MMDLSEWRVYRTCWCPTPQDCSPCTLYRSRILSPPKAPKSVGPSVGQSRLIQFMPMFRDIDA
jgi:hypothetical protein